MRSEVACNIWFTATGKAMPLMIKYKNSTGEIKSIHDIRVIHDKEQIYSGVKSHEYICKGTVNHDDQYFKLIFYQDRVIWVMEGMD